MFVCNFYFSISSFWFGVIIWSFLIFNYNVLCLHVSVVPNPTILDIRQWFLENFSFFTREKKWWQIWHIFFLLAQKWMSVESSQSDQEKILKEANVWSDFTKCVSVRLKTFLFSHLKVFNFEVHRSSRCWIKTLSFAKYFSFSL